jgi:tetratricopeptide (TPR) repeat protein
MPVAASHPPPEQLAAYADHTLSTADRDALERHLAGCAECRDVIFETIAFLRAEQQRAGRPSRPFRLGWVIAWGSLAAAAVLGLAIRTIRPQLFSIAPTSQPTIETVVGVVTQEPTRPVEGRLGPPFPYAPPPSVTRGVVQSGVSAALTIVIQNMEHRIGTDDSADLRWSLGVALLAARQFDRAIQVLEVGAQRWPDAAPLHNVLSTAYLARFKETNNGGDLQRSLAEADRALHNEPTSLDAMFNRALALEYLGRRGDARGVWQSLLQRESDAGWRGEVERHLTAIP